MEELAVILTIITALFQLWDKIMALFKMDFLIEFRSIFSKHFKKNLVFDEMHITHY